jgi:hypothetical protein
MPMLACVHHVTWVAPAPTGKHQCQYCKEFVTKKDIYPKWEDLGAEFQAKWDRHERGETDVKAAADAVAGTAAGAAPAQASGPPPETTKAP